MPDLAGPPTGPVSVPAALIRLLEARGLGESRLTPVWANSVGGVTFSIASGGQGAPIDFFAKWNPRSSGESLADEAERLRWIEGMHPAPQVIELAENDRDEVLLTAALPGTSAVDERWKREPRIALRALGRGLRRLHELPIDCCPFDWGVEHRMGVGRVPASAAGEPPPIDRLVVCQGDPCAPNTLIAEDGTFLAHVDLARLGLADRWADLAVMTLSFEWNYEHYDEADFWEAYGIQPDARRIAYYRRLWNAE